VRLLSMLAAAIGLPYLVLSTTGPLLQAWFSQTRPGASPWRLYALSNLGSLLALLAYPTVVEPLIALPMQALLWSLGYLVYAFGCWRCAHVAVAVPAPALVQPDSWLPASAGSDAVAASDLPPEGGSHGISGGSHEDELPSPRAPELPSRLRYLVWLALAAVPSLLLCAVTNQMCQEVAPVPFLWILPLALYLLSFIICFAGDRWYWRWFWQPALVLSAAAAYMVLERGVAATFMAQLITFPVVLFAAAMVCHGELVRLRPTPSHLTSFYLTIAAGGALGSAFVAIVAPRIFDGFWELHLGLLLTGSLTILVLVLDERSWIHQRTPWPALAAVAVMGALWILPVDQGLEGVRDAAKEWLDGHRAISIGTAVSLPLAAALRWWRPAPFLRASLWISSALLLASLWILGHLLVTSAETARAAAISVTRNFYGVIAVTQNDVGDPNRHRYVLQHGRIEHGHQLRAPELRRLPASYYTESSGIYIAVASHPRRVSGGDVRIGMVGLGTGTSAVLAEAGDTIRFYEINPAVIDLSLGPANLFTYLKDCPGHVDVVLGDARLSLESELREGHPQQFDVLGIDAFSSDAIPAHLLTKQAIEIYLRHLRQPNGILAVHISNRYLDLQPVVRAAAVALNLATAVVESNPSADRDPDASSSTWVLLAPDPNTLARPEIASVAETTDGRTARLWTDDYTNLLAAVTSKSIFR